MTPEKIGEPKECAKPKDQDLENTEIPPTDKELVDYYTWHINFPCKTQTSEGIVNVRKEWMDLAQKIIDKKAIKDPAEEKRLKYCLDAYRDE